MPTFVCKIGTADGRVLEKEFEGANRVMLRETLEEQGFHVFEIKKRHFQFLYSKNLGGGRPGSRRFLSFNQELVVLLRSGLPILQVLDTLLERMEGGGLFDVLREVRDDIKGGSILSEAFGKFPRFFPPLYIASIKAGERTGDLPVTLGRYIAYQKRVEALKAKVRSASFYPILLTVAVVCVLTFLILYVIPSFTQIYADAKVQLPLVTRILIGFSTNFTRSLPLLVPLLLVLGFLLAGFLRSDRGLLAWHRLQLRLPFFGELARDYSLAGFCRTLGTTLSSGMPMVPALQMSRGTLNNRHLEAAMARATRRVEEGTSFSSALDQSAIFPIIALRMIGVGETSGALADMLGDVADYYEGEVERRLDRLTTMIEPAMMLIMGLLIGGIVIAMYIPIFQLAGTVG